MNLLWTAVGRNAGVTWSRRAGGPRWTGLCPHSVGTAETGEETGPQAGEGKGVGPNGNNGAGDPLGQSGEQAEADGHPTLLTFRYTLITIPPLQPSPALLFILLLLSSRA